MSWEQLEAIMQENRVTHANWLRDPPVACPNDGVPLDVKGDNTRNCPLGDYRWYGQPKIR